MKRSERFSRNARHEAMLGMAFLTASIAAGVWAVAATQNGTAVVGTALIAGAATAFALGTFRFREMARYRRLSRTEAWWEYHRGIRPRL